MSVPPDAANFSLKNAFFRRVVLCCFAFLLCCCCLSLTSLGGIVHVHCDFNCMIFHRKHYTETEKQDIVKKLTTEVTNKISLIHVRSNKTLLHTSESGSCVCVCVCVCAVVVVVVRKSKMEKEGRNVYNVWFVKWRVNVFRCSQEVPSIKM